MKLSVKLPLAFMAALMLLMMAALFGIQQLNQALNVYETTVAHNYEHERSAATMLQDFKVQVQEWKNTLLRGKDPAQLDKYWSQFEAQERKVQDSLGKLSELAADDRTLSGQIDTLRREHQTLGVNYRKGRDAFIAAGGDATVGDKAVSGIDRNTTQQLEALAARLRSNGKKPVKRLKSARARAWRCCRAS